MRKLYRKLIRETMKPSNHFVDQVHKVLVYESEAKRVAKLTLRYPDRETGGSLFGYWTHSGSPVVSLASDPGRGSRHNSTSFFQSESYLYDLGTKLYDQHGMQHVGEWHSHHRMGLNTPSQGDVNTIISGMTKKNWPRFLLLITTIEDPLEGLVLENFFLFSSRQAEPEPLRILTLPGSSPFRTDSDTGRVDSANQVTRMAWRPGPFTPGIHQAAEELFPEAWFTKPQGRAYLMKVVEDFRAVGIECRIVLSKESGEIKLLLGDTELLLGPLFPEKSPEWIASTPPENPKKWSTSDDIVEWYLRSRKAVPKNSDANNGDVNDNGY